MNFEKFLHDKPRNFNHRRMSYVFEEDDDGDLELTESDAEKIVNTLIPKIIVTLRENINFNAKSVDDVADTLDDVLNKIKRADLDQIDPELKKYYCIQDNGFYKVNVSDTDREMLKNKFRALGFSALSFTDSRSKYQFYNLARLWSDIQTALTNGVKLWHPATEPVSAGEVYKYLTGKEFINELGGIPADYDYRTIHAALFGGSNGYIYNKRQVLKEIKEFVEK